MIIKKVAQTFLLLAPLYLLTGCLDLKSDKKTSPSTTFSLAVTDAPVDDMRYVVVEFTAVILQPSDGDRIVINMDEPVRIDLLSLQGHVHQYLVMDREIPPGDYEWIRLEVNANLDGVMNSYVELHNGAQLELDLPSEYEPGLRLTQGFVARDGGTVDVTVDFDLRRSILIPERNSVVSAVFKPSLRKVETRYAGSIEGKVDRILIGTHCENPNTEFGAVYLFERYADIRDVSGDQGPIASALVHYDNGDYRYELGFLSSGDYRLAYTCDAARDNPESDDNLTFIRPDQDVTTVHLAENLILDFVFGAEPGGSTDNPEDTPPGEPTPEPTLPPGVTPSPAPTPEPDGEEASPTPEPRPGFVEPTPTPITEPTPTPVPPPGFGEPTPTPTPIFEPTPPLEPALPSPTPNPEPSPGFGAPTPAPTPEPGFGAPTPIPDHENSVPTPEPNEPRPIEGPIIDEPEGSGDGLSLPIVGEIDWVFPGNSRNRGGRYNNNTADDSLENQSELEDNHPEDDDKEEEQESDDDAEVGSLEEVVR